MAYLKSPTPKTPPYTQKGIDIDIMYTNEVMLIRMFGVTLLLRL